MQLVDGKICLKLNSTCSELLANRRKLNASRYGSGIQDFDLIDVENEQLEIYIVKSLGIK